MLLLSLKFESFNEKKSDFGWHITSQNSAKEENRYTKILTIVEVREKYMSACYFISDFSITWSL